REKVRLWLENECGRRSPAVWFAAFYPVRATPRNIGRANFRAGRAAIRFPATIQVRPAARPVCCSRIKPPADFGLSAFHHAEAWRRWMDFGLFPPKRREAGHF